jgi:hypothetical protein
MPLIEYLVAAEVRVAIGHTAATPQQLGDAIAAGATLATHLGNGCPQMLPRHPNVIWELLAADAVLASVIADGHHLPAATVKTMVRAKSAERTILVTDAIAAAGCAPGRYTIGGVGCELGADGRVSLPGTPYLAGSSLTLDRAIANTVRYTGLRLEAVIPMASTIPAAYLGMTTAGTVTAIWDARGVRTQRARVAHDDHATRLGRARRLLRRHHRDRPRRRLPRAQERRVLSSAGAASARGDDRPELRRRHARRDAGGARRRRLQHRRVRHLVPVEEPLHHPFYWLMAPVFRRVRRTTMAEFTEDRYGPWMGAIYIVFAVCFFIINTAAC